MRRCLIPPVLALAVLAAACSGSSIPAGTSIAGSDWCKASQLEMRLVFLGLAAPNVEGIVDVRNKGSRDCDLSAYPAIQLLDDAGRPLPTHAHETTPAVEVDVTLGANSEPLSTSGPKADHAYIVLTWAGDRTPPCERPAAFRITPWGVDGGIVVSATSPIEGAPVPYVCGGGAIRVLPIQPAKTVAPFGPGSAPSPTGPPLVIPSPVTPFVPCPAADLSMGFFVLGVAGGTVRGTIEVRNDSGQACDLQGYAGLLFLDANRKALPAHVIWTGEAPWSSSPLPADAVGLPTGTPAISGSQVPGHAYFPMWWSDVQPPCVLPSVIEVTAPYADRAVFIQTPALPPGFCSDGTVHVNPTQAASND